MKKVLSMILIFAVLLSCLAITAFAEGQNGKISAELAEQLAALPEGTKAETHIWLYCPIDKGEVFRLTIRECGYTAGLPLDMTLEEVYAYKAAYNRIVSEKEAAVGSSFIEKLGIPEEDLVYHGKHPYVVAMLTRAQIERAATFGEVESISLNDTAAVLTEAPVEPPEPGYFYQDSFRQKYESEYIKVEIYRELYYHADGSGAIDWALVRCEMNLCAPAIYTDIIGNRVFSHSSYASPFSSGYAVYDVKEDRFLDAASREAAAYGGLTKAFDENVTEGRLLGDLDKDNELSIIDVTIIQRCVAQMRDYPDDDAITLYPWQYDFRYYSDFDRDGERGITDATKLQRYLVS